MDISLLHRDESEESAQQYQWLIEPVHIETEGKDEVRVFVCDMGRDFEIVRGKCSDSLISSSSTKDDQPEIMTTFNLFSGTTELSCVMTFISVFFTSLLKKQ